MHLKLNLGFLLFKMGSEMEDSESENVKAVAVHRGFLDLEPSEEVLNRPPGGHVYLYHWNDVSRKGW